MANLSNLNNKFIVTDGGQALINQTAAGFNPDADDLIVGNLSGNTGITIACGSSAGNYGSIYFADAAGSGTASKAGYIRYEQNTSKMTFGINAVEKVAIDLSGNVGIGTASPSYGLDVVKGTEVQARFVGSSTGHTQGAIVLSSGTADTPSARGQGVYRFNEGNDTTWYTGTAYNAADTYIWARQASTASLDTGTAQTTHAMMTLTSAGNVGIGTTAIPTNGYIASGGGWKMLQIGQSSQIAAYGTDDEIAICQNTYLNTSGVFQAITSNVAGSSIILVDGKMYFKNASTSGTAQTTSTRMFIDTDGKVGIGTTSPQNILHLKSDDPKLILEDGNAGSDEKVYAIYPAGSQYVLQTMTDAHVSAQNAYVVNRTGTVVDDQNWYVNNNLRLNLDTYGGTFPKSYLFVGTENANNGTTYLTLRNYDTTLVDAGDVQNMLRMTGRYWSGSASQLVETRITSIHELANGNGGSALGFMTQTGGSTPVEQMRIGRSGELTQGPNVNSTTPNTALLRLANTSVYGGSGAGPYGNYGAIIFNASTHYTGGAKRYMITNQYLGNCLAFIRSTDATTDPAVSGNSATVSSGSVSYYINSSGQNIFPEYVGIGTTSPSNTLHVENSGNLVTRWTGGSTFSLYQNNTDGSVIFSANHGNASPVGVEKRFIWQMAGGTSKMKLDDGNLTVSGDVVAYGSPSDKRLKENIKPVKSALDKVSKLQGVTFDWKDKKQDKAYDPDQGWKHDIGFIAQDVQKVVPELVRENDNGMLSMRHQGMAPILLEAIKELKAEIEELKQKPCNCK